jgi:thiol:disulfide interchange protein
MSVKSGKQTFQMRFGLRGLLFVVVIAASLFAVVRVVLDARQLSFRTYSSEALFAALQNGDCVVVSFHANWDAASINRLTRISSKLKKQIRNSDAICFEADWSAKSLETSALMKLLAIDTVPALAFFSGSSLQQPIVLKDWPQEAAIEQALNQCCR